MRTVSNSDVDVPRWALWLVAVVCFGPLTCVWLLGVLYSVFWLPLLLAMQVGEPSGFPDDSGEAIRSVFAVIALVSAGGLGLVGLVRVLTLPRHERPESHRYVTIAMVAVGLAALLIFDLPMIVDPTPAFSDGLSLVGPLVYAVLPFTGAAWLLAKSWRFLLGGPVRDVESRSSRIRRGSRDDWRLDA
jgi:hypothetical protein